MFLHLFFRPVLKHFPNIRIFLNRFPSSNVVPEDRPSSNRPSCQAVHWVPGDRHMALGWGRSNQDCWHTAMKQTKHFGRYQSPLEMVCTWCVMSHAHAKRSIWNGPPTARLPRHTLTGVNHFTYAAKKYRSQGYIRNSQPHCLTQHNSSSANTETYDGSIIPRELEPGWTTTEKGSSDCHWFEKTSI